MSKKKQLPAEKSLDNETILNDELVKFYTALEYVVERISDSAGKKVIKAVQSDLKPKLSKLTKAIKKSQANFG